MEEETIKEKFFKMKNIYDICDILNITNEQLRYILFVRTNNYKTFQIKKKNRFI